MTNDELSAIDAILARKEALPYEQAQALRDQLALVAARAVRRNAELLNELEGYWDDPCLY